MQKIPTLFLRNEEDRKYVTKEINPECAWVLDGEGVATRKYDGTCVMHDEFGWWARREVKENRTTPEGFEEVNYDPITKKRMGWIPIEYSPFHKHFLEAVGVHSKDFAYGTYELCGPKINGNPEGYFLHVLRSHDRAEQIMLPEKLDYRTVVRVLQDLPAWEGIVWHHVDDGRMAKLKQRDIPNEDKVFTPREEFELKFGKIIDDDWEWLKEFVERNHIPSSE